MEEYSIAKQLWHFSAVDLCEMARNSVLQSGFSDEMKARWLGLDDFWVENDPASSNVPDIRMSFRKRLLSEELRMVRGEARAGEQADESSMCELLLLSPACRQAALDTARRIQPMTELHAMSAEGQQDVEEYGEEFRRVEVPDDWKTAMASSAAERNSRQMELRKELLRRPSFQALIRRPSFNMQPPPWLTTAVSAAALAGALGGATAVIMAMRMSRK